jgi:hypothetical protein
MQSNHHSFLHVLLASPWCLWDISPHCLELQHRERPSQVYGRNHYKYGLFDYTFSVDQSWTRRKAVIVAVNVMLSQSYMPVWN